MSNTLIPAATVDFPHPVLHTSFGSRAAVAPGDNGSVPEPLSPALKGSHRRDFLFGIAGAAALLPFVAESITPDPVFAAIDLHRSAYKEIERLFRVTDEVAAEQEGRKITQSDIDAAKAAEAADEELYAAFVATVPTTVAGARAAIEWLITVERAYMEDGVFDFLTTLMESPLLAA